VTELAALVRARVAETGPMRLDTFMALALGHPTHGYYATRDPLGAGGDFITAPEISQMFGELVGLWLVQAWLDQGRPAPFVLAEFGPGRGTLMRDALRAAGSVPDFLAAARLWLVETSAPLCARQRETLAAHDPRWASRPAELPPGPLFAVANEFLDALPIRQVRRTDAAWSERSVDLAGDDLVLAWGPPRPDAELDRRFPDLADGGVAEVGEAGEAMAAGLGARVAGAGGAALLVDYGAWDGVGDTLQAVRNHRPVDPLDAPGTADLTAHVRFRDIAAAGRPAKAWGTVGQGTFLERLGITPRAQALVRGKSAADTETIVAAHRRLTHPDEMGNLFQVLAFLPGGAPAPPGFS
jgi:NADH dehydrogenase [ubiquinone] 1 alpha subcomplex assembly factor 7